jgi:hypothetical protein
MIITIITGSRNWQDRAAIERALHGSDGAILGDCSTGADAIALEVCKSWDIAVTVHKADWTKHGKGAGPKRNQAMADDAIKARELGFDVRCYAFRLPDSRGTVDCIARLRMRGFEVMEING